MSQKHETAYPQLKNYYSRKELERYYAPNTAELALVRSSTNHSASRLCFLILLKTAQHLGYFPQIAEVPKSLVRFLSFCLGYRQGRRPNKRVISQYDQSGNRQRHLKIIRAAIGIKPFDQSASQLLPELALKAAEAKEHLPDIINVILEELVRHCYELPSFPTLLIAAKSAKKQTRESLFKKYRNLLTPRMVSDLDRLLVAGSNEEHYSLWHQYRRECAKPTSKVIQDYLKWLSSVKKQAEALPPLVNIPVSRKNALLHEARSYNAWQMRRLEHDKRYTLLSLLITRRYATALDDVGDIFIRLIRKIHHRAKQDHQEHLLKNTCESDKLISRFHKILLAWKTHTPLDTAVLDSLLDQDTDHWIEACEQHLKMSDDTHYPFLMTPFRKKRGQLFNCLELIKLQPTSEGDKLIQALTWVQSIRYQRRNRLVEIPDELSDSSWLPRRWQSLVVREAVGETWWHHNYLDLAVFTLIMEGLNAGDIYIESGDVYSDYREKLISWEDYQVLLPKYCLHSSLSSDPEHFTHTLQESLRAAAVQADKQFPDNQQVRFENERLVLARPEAKQASAKLADIQRMLDEHMPSLSILDLLIDTESWLDLHHWFGPASGAAGRLSDPRKRFIATLFCYGCNLGPSQTARSIKELSRKQIAWLNIGYISEEALDKAIVAVINAYNRFQLPGSWGSGETAAADGTHWDLYKQNLLSDYHLRYGKYGGIGYYHISDTYIALFSNFLSCSTYEGIHILDGLLKNESEIQPNTVHGDTHAQNEPVFALAYLLGIDLMPRIRRIADLNFYRPDAQTRYQHIDALFDHSIQWNLIKRHLPEMLRVAISIQQGMIDSSAILKRLGSGTRKNRLYFAFRELGRAVKTCFLLKYIMDIELRKTISQATNKCEEFNDFCKWLMFGGDGVIAENLRHEQRKVVKYNHLVSNLVILHNVQNMSLALKDIATEGIEITPELLSGLSPYRRHHINRFGDYRLDMDRPVPKMNNNLVIPVKHSEAREKTKNNSDTLEEVG